MFKEMYFCDRKGCSNTTEATGNGPFFYNDLGWIGVKASDAGMPHDFCSWECLGLWVDAKIQEVRGGK